MKFPKKLSKERLSLLSTEDRKVYEYEHSGLCPEMKQFHESKSNSLIDIDSTDIYTIQEKNELKQILDELLFNSEMDNLFDKELIEEIGIDEYNDIKKNIFEYIQSDPDLKTLNEAEGHSMDWWVDCSWIVKLSAGLLTGLLGIVAWLVMKGKDRLALLKLKQYMNKLVELTDQGVNKKRPWYSFLMCTRKAKQNTGDYNKACFRTIQETAERNLACLYASAIHDLGFLSPNASSFSDMVGGGQPQMGSGLDKFNDITLSLSGDAESVYIAESDKKLLPVKINTEYFNNLSLPGLPTNFSMLMSNIDFPTKANKNPNGSLFMKPTEEILKSGATDLGTKCFNNNVNLKNIINKTTNKNESFFNSQIYKELFEVENEDGLDKTTDGEFGSIFTPDSDPTYVGGADLEQETMKREQTKVNEYKGDIIGAIDTYVVSSVPIMNNLLRGICGESTNLKEFGKLVMQINSAAKGNIAKYMSKEEEVLQKILTKRYEEDTEKQRKALDILKQVTKFQDCLRDEEFRNKIRFKSSDKCYDEFSKFISENEITEKNLDIIIEKYTMYDSFKEVYKEVQKFLNDKLAKQHTQKQLQQYPNQNISTSVSYLYDIIHKLDEDILSYKYKRIFEDEQIKGEDEILSSLNKSLETSYEEIKDKLQECIVGLIDSDPKSWYIIKNAKERMIKLKDAADKEIQARIDLICRTANTAQSSLGDKFKSALSKHPIRAEGLKNIWARYSDDLTDRIENRINLISGGTSSQIMITSLQEFALKTYPNLIAIMLYYKQIFYLIQLYTKKYPIQEEAQSKLIEIQKSKEISHIQLQLNNLEIKEQQNQNQGNIANP